MTRRAASFLARQRNLVVLGTMCAAATIASASPPSMPTITFPIDQASIGTAVATAGALILITTFGVMIGFKLVRKLTRRVTGSV